MKKHEPAKSSRAFKAKKKFHIYIAVLIIWLIAVTAAIFKIYDIFNDFLIDYQTSYEASNPDLVMEEIFAEFEGGNMDFIMRNLAERPVLSAFEDEQTMENYMRDMISGKTLSYTESGEYTQDSPCYVVKADGYVVATVKLMRDLTAINKYGFPSYTLSSISYPVQPFESASIKVPDNFTVYANGIALNEAFITEQFPANEADLPYVEPYGGTIPGFCTYTVSGLYCEPEIKAEDFNGNDISVYYDQDFDLYSCDYSSYHPEREFLEQFAIEYTDLFANVISMDADIEELTPFFPPDSLALSYISRNTALSYFTGHGAVTMQNEQIPVFIAYNETTVYIECYTEQNMQMWPDPEILPTTTHLYITKIDGQWKISGIRY